LHCTKMWTATSKLSSIVQTTKLQGRITVWQLLI
jgi:hypothetical protein